MSNYNSLKTTINANVKQNGRQEITGSILNSVLNAMVNTLGAGYQFAGVATTATNPGSPDAKVFYIANGKGTYTNFGGLEVTEDEVVILYWDSSWHKMQTEMASYNSFLSLEALSWFYSKSVPQFSLTTKKYIAVSSHSYITTAQELYVVSSNIPVSAGDVVVLVSKWVQPSNFAIMSITKQDDESIGSMLVNGSMSYQKDGKRIYQLTCPVSGYMKLSYVSSSFVSVSIYHPTYAQLGSEEIIIGTDEAWKMGIEGMSYRIVGDITMTGSNYPYGSIPNNSSLVLDGGKISGTLVGNNTKICPKVMPCFSSDITISGTFNNENVDSRFFDNPTEVDVLVKLFSISSENTTIYIAPQDSPYMISFSAENQRKISIKDGTHLILDGTIKVVPNGYQRYEVFSIFGKDIMIDGKGSLVGDKDDHDYDTTQGTHEWGKGIGIHEGASHIVISNLDISGFTGDCIITGQTAQGVAPKNIKFDSLILHNSRRQGISVTSGNLIEVTNCHFYEIDGTNPSAAVDLEPDHDSVVISNVWIANNYIHNCGNGIISNFRHGHGENVVIENNRIYDIYPLMAGDLVAIASNNIVNCRIANNEVVNFNRVGIQITADEDSESGVSVIENNTIKQYRPHLYYDGFSSPSYIPQAIMFLGDGSHVSDIINGNHIEVYGFADAIRMKEGVCSFNIIVADNAFTQYNSEGKNLIMTNNKIITSQSYQKTIVDSIFSGNRVNNIFKTQGIPNIGVTAMDGSVIDLNVVSGNGLNYVNDTFYTGGDYLTRNPNSIEANIPSGKSSWVFMLNRDYGTTKNYIPPTKIYIDWDGEKNCAFTYWYTPEGETGRRSMAITEKGIHELPESYLPASGSVGLNINQVTTDMVIRINRLLQVTDIQ